MEAVHLPLVLDFFIKHALTDAEKTVAEHATKVMLYPSFAPPNSLYGTGLQAGVGIIAQQGQAHMGDMLPILENFLDRPAPSQLPPQISDQVREAVVIFLGTLARHLAADDPKVGQVVDRLMEALKTPAELVQKAVSQCLASLVKIITNDSQKERYVGLLLDRLLKGSSYGDRRGAAYGLAGCALFLFIYLFVSLPSSSATRAHDGGVQWSKASASRFSSSLASWTSYKQLWRTRRASPLDRAPSWPCVHSAPSPRLLLLPKAHSGPAKPVRVPLHDAQAVLRTLHHPDPPQTAPIVQRPERAGA